jgi:hypothetical protein
MGRTHDGTVEALRSRSHLGRLGRTGSYRRHICAADSLVRVGRGDLDTEHGARAVNERSLEHREIQRAFNRFGGVAPSARFAAFSVDNGSRTCAGRAAHDVESLASQLAPCSTWIDDHVKRQYAEIAARARATAYQPAEQ